MKQTYLIPRAVSPVMAAKLVVTKAAPTEPREFSLKKKNQHNVSSLLHDT
jgi:hypothetical protein